LEIRKARAEVTEDAENDLRELEMNRTMDILYNRGQGSQRSKD
jgi:hypothetical protein